MKVFEVYEKEIREIGLDNIARVNGKITDCRSLKCEYCDFKNVLCRKEVLDWLYEEYKEPLKLTKRERMFCELARTGWITRDNSSHINWYITKPFKGHYQWATGTDNYIKLDTLRLNSEFKFVKWEDKEPWSVQDLLKLEVKGE